MQLDELDEDDVATRLGELIAEIAAPIACEGVLTPGRPITITLPDGEVATFPGVVQRLFRQREQRNGLLPLLHAIDRRAAAWPRRGEGGRFGRGEILERIGEGDKLAFKIQFEDAARTILAKFVTQV